MKIKRMACTALLTLAIVGEALFGGFPSAKAQTVGQTQSVGLTNAETVVFKPAAVSRRADGGENYTYNVNGDTTVFPVPKKGFDPLTASDEELEENAFPARPKDAAALNRWEDTMKYYKETVTPGIEIKKDMPKKATIVWNKVSQNWSGYVANTDSGSAGDQWVAVEGDFTQVGDLGGSTYYVNDDNSSIVSTWVGLGGENCVNGRYRLVQAGTDLTINGQGQSEFCVWYEYLNSITGEELSEGVYPVVCNFLSVHKLDKIHVYVSFETANNRCDFYVLDETTGQAAQSYILGMVDHEKYYDGSTAEWINEKPATFMPNCHSETWSDCYAFSSDQKWHTLGSTGHYSILLEDNNNKGLMCPGFLTSNTSFMNYRLSN